MHVTEAHRESVEAEAAPIPVDLPLVSIIIVNYNYGRFLRQAVASVIAQSYPHIECIIVDDASSDDSAEVLHSILKQHPDITVLRRAANGGQSIASKDGFEACRGDYVVFLDADDYLLPSFVETHVFVHLSLRIPVGFTSADMAQSVDSRLVLGTIYRLSEFVRSGKGKCRDALRRIDNSAGTLWPLSRPDEALEDDVHLVRPKDLDFRSWFWAPTSANCFRRDALRLFLNNEDLGELRSCTDAYLLRGVGLLMGSAVIDRPLAVYRLHGVNIFSKHPNLYGMLSYERGGSSDNDLLGRKIVIDHLIAKAKLFLRKLESPQQYMRALKVLDSAWPRIPSTVRGRRTYAAGKLVAQSAVIVQELGLFNFVLLLVQLKVAPQTILRACLRRKIGEQM